MKASEKKCPKCAEIIKREAVVCKHCGHHFSAAEIAAEREQLQKSQQQGGIGCVVIILAIVAISMCSKGSDEQSADVGAQPSRESAATEGPVQDRPGYDEFLIAKTQEGIKAKLKDPNSAQFSDVRVARLNGRKVVCGLVNSNNSFGGKSGRQRFIGVGEAAFMEEEGEEAVGEVWDQASC